jgi:hypothetical protein
MINGSFGRVGQVERAILNTPLLTSCAPPSFLNVKSSNEHTSLASCAGSNLGWPAKNKINICLPRSLNLSEMDA